MFVIRQQKREAQIKAENPRPTSYVETLLQRKSTKSGKVEPTPHFDVYVGDKVSGKADIELYNLYPIILCLTYSTSNRTSTTWFVNYQGIYGWWKRRQA